MKQPINEQLPIKDVVLNETDNFILRISNVEKPAIKTDFLMFNEQEVRLSMNDERRIVVGAVLIPEQLIPRIDPDTNEKYLLRFSADTIEKLAERFVKEGRGQATNLQHDGKDSVDGLHFKDIWVSDKALGIHPPDAFKHLPYGTMFATERVNNDKVWQDMKDGKINGFSIEAMLNVMHSMNSLDNFLNEIEAILKS